MTSSNEEPRGSPDVDLEKAGPKTVSNETAEEYPGWQKVS